MIAPLSIERRDCGKPAPEGRCDREVADGQLPCQARARRLKDNRAHHQQELET
jgi:hypothetical protein